MFTKSAAEKLIKWSTDWSNFEVPGRMLDEVEADFEYLDSDFRTCIPDIIIQHIEELSADGKRDMSLDSGTLLVISGLRDKWTEADVSKVISSLGFLIPPGEQSVFTIFAQESIIG